MKIKRISDEVHVVIGGFFPLCNTLVILSDEIAVVDPGCSVESLRFLLRKEGKELRDIDVVLLSHIHPDHITHAARLNRLSRCRVAANEITAPLFDDKEQMKRFLGFTPGHLIRPLWEDLVNERMYGALDDCKTTDIVKDGETFLVGGHSLKMRCTPGHLPDHMCIELVEENLLFASDIDLTEFGPFYGHPNSSIPEFKESIKKVMDGGYRGIISGHLKEPLIEDYEPGLRAYLKQFDMREEFVLLAVRGGAKTINDIVVNPIIYPSLTNVVYLQFEKWMIEHHVDSLIERGLIWEHKGVLSVA